MVLSRVESCGLGVEGRVLSAEGRELSAHLTYT